MGYSFHVIPDMTRKKAVALLSLLAATGSVLAATPAKKKKAPVRVVPTIVERIRGEVHLVRGSRNTRIASEQSLAKGDVIVTDANSSARLSRPGMAMDLSSYTAAGIEGPGVTLKYGISLLTVSP